MAKASHRSVEARPKYYEDCERPGTSGPGPNSKDRKREKESRVRHPGRPSEGLPLGDGGRGPVIGPAKSVPGMGVTVPTRSRK